MTQILPVMATICHATIGNPRGLGVDADNRRLKRAAALFEQNLRIRREVKMNKIAIMAAAAAAAVSFGVGGVLAQAGGDFASADANKDGFVSQDEAMGVYPTLTADIFAKADANGDGKLDAGEYGSLQGLTAAIEGNQTSSSTADTSSSGADASVSASVSASASAGG